MIPDAAPERGPGSRLCATLSFFHERSPAEVAVDASLSALVGRLVDSLYPVTRAVASALAAAEVCPPTLCTLLPPELPSDTVLP